MIRPATGKDRLGLGAVYCRSWQAAYQGILPQSFLDSLTPESSAPPADRIRPENNYIYEETDKVVGLVNFGENRDSHSEKWGEIRSIYVLPTHWKQGIGCKLFLAASAALKAAGYDGFYLWVLADNRRARTFYAQMGMAFSGEERTIQIAGKDLSEVKYEYHF